MIEIKEGSLPQWDEQSIFRSRVDPEGNQTNNPFASLVLAPFAKGAGVIARQRRLGELGSMSEHMVLLEEVLNDNQGYHRVDPMGNPWKVIFPYALFLKKADPIRNLTTGEVYTVNQVLDEDTNETMLSGNVAPKVTDRLRLDSENIIQFAHGFPRSLVNSAKIEINSEIADQVSSYNECVQWLLQTSVPTTDGNKTPFAIRGLRPSYKETYVDPNDPFRTIDVSSLGFDNIVAFDCWARNNRRAEEIVDWFEDTVLRSRWILESFGGCKVYYWKRDEDEEVYRYRNDLTKRTVKFHYRTERLYHSSSGRLKQVDVRASFSDGTETPEVPSSDILLWPDQKDKSTSVTNEST